MPKTVQVKQFGLQRTGTNWLAVILRRNFQVAVLVNKGGWKHGGYHVHTNLGHHTHVLVLAKHPLSWLVSMHRYVHATHKKKKITFPTYVRSTEPIVKWNLYYRYWLDFKPKAGTKKAIIRYETLIEHPEATCDRLATKFGFPRKREPFDAFTNRVRAGEKDSGRPFNMTYYSKNKWMKCYSPQLRDFVSKQLDWSVVKELGYA